MRDQIERLRQKLMQPVDYSKFKEVVESAVYTQIPHPIYVADMDYNILHINPVLQKLVGNVIGKKCYKEFQGLDSPCEWCTNKDLLSKGEIVWEFYNKKFDKWYKCYDKIIDFAGKKARFELAVDITDIKEQSIIIENQAKAIRGLMNALPIGIAITKRNGVISQVNDIFAEALGYTKEEILKMNAYHLYKNFDERTKLLEKHEDTNLLIFRTELIKKDGTVAEFSIKSNKIVNGDIVYVNTIEEIK